MFKKITQLLIVTFCTITFNSFGTASGHNNNENDNKTEPKNSSDKNRFFSAYKPNYLIGSTSGGKNSSEDLKFQISFKQRLALSEDGEAIDEIDKDWRKRFYFGYTQRSFWDIGRDSAPFRDSVFSPELFYATENDDAANHRRMQFGLVHASNGRDGNNSRSWNRAYGEVVYSYGHDLSEPLFGKDTSNGFEGSTTPKISIGLTAWYIINTGDENNDIEDYLGYGRAMVKYSTKGEQINLSSWYGSEGKVSVEGNLLIKTLPLLNRIPFIGEALPSPRNTYFWQIQYFNGYGDELLEYDSRQRVARLGLLFTY